MSEGVGGRTFYVDFDRIRKVNGFVYYWVLSDYLTESIFGEFSAKFYNQGDCKLFRYKELSNSYHKQPMGKGIPSVSSNKPDKEWVYPSPDSAMEINLNIVCNWSKKEWWQFW